MNKDSEQSLDNKKLNIIDWEEALRLANHNHELAKDMLKLLTERLPEDRDDIVQAFQQQDWDRLKQFAHKLRGALCYCGVPRLRKITEQIDNELKKPTNIPLITKLISQFEHEVELLLDIVKQRGD